MFTLSLLTMCKTGNSKIADRRLQIVIFSSALRNLVVLLHIYGCEKNNASRPDGEVFSFSMYDKLI